MKFAVLFCSIALAAQVQAMEISYEDLVLPTLIGEPMSLGQFRRGKILLMDFASW